MNDFRTIRVLVTKVISNIASTGLRHGTHIPHDKHAHRDKQQ
jgi:hypothetical protein